MNKTNHKSDPDYDPIYDSQAILAAMKRAVHQAIVENERAAELEGRHYVFKGRPIQVFEDADHQRWIRLADVRAVAGFTARDAALQITYPRGWQIHGRPPELHLSDEALLAHLMKERSPSF